MMKTLVLLLTMLAGSCLSYIGIVPRVKKTDIDFTGQRAIETNSADSHLVESSRHRGVRRPQTCQYDHDILKEAEIQCTLYPSKIVCNQTCIFGYTLSTGIRQQTVCIHAENRWEPGYGGEVERCKPFIDCNLAPISSGNVICQNHFMKKGAHCEVSCGRYEDKPAVPTGNYKCTIEGKWMPELPFCVQAGSGLDLVPPPQDLNY